MTHIVFTFLCGCIYLIGMLFGWSYQDASVYICIYACPWICITCAALSLLNCTTKTFLGSCRTALNSSLLIVYYILAYGFWAYYDVDASPFETIIRDEYAPAVPNPFAQCVADITSIANTLGISYEACNLLIYCGLFGSIVAFHLIQLILFRENKLFFNRPWFRKMFVKRSQSSMKY